MYRSQVALAASSVISAGLLITAVGSTAHLNVDFAGTLRTSVGMRECLAVRVESSAQETKVDEAGAIVGGVPGDALVFHNPEIARNWIDPDSTYVVAQLPFFVRLEDVTVLAEREPRNTLRVTSPDDESSHIIASGDAIPLTGATLRTQSIQKWSGLLRQESGRPMATLRLRKSDAPWSETLFLTSGAWLRLGEDIGLVLRWSDSEEAAREALKAGLPTVAAPRWGVVDQGAINWFASFMPGTGTDLAGGGSVTLLEYTPAGEAGRESILVEIERANDVEQRRVYANEGEEDDLVRFDNPLMRSVVYLLLAWQDNQALAVLLRDGKAAGSALIETGDVWKTQDGEWALRLDQVLSSAIPVKAEDSPLFEAVVEIDGQELALREGQSVRWNELVLQFERYAPAPLVRYELSFVDEGGARLGSATLGAGSSVEFRGWRFSQGALDSRRPDVGVLFVTRPWVENLSRWGVAMALIGLVGVFCSLFFPKRPVPPVSP